MEKKNHFPRKKRLFLPHVGVSYLCLPCKMRKFSLCRPFLVLSCQRIGVLSSRDAPVGTCFSLSLAHEALPYQGNNKPLYLLRNCCTQTWPLLSTTGSLIICRPKGGFTQSPHTEEICAGRFSFGDKMVIFLSIHDIRAHACPFHRRGPGARCCAG